jgi:7-cyano-7-deazaguanine synthase
VKLLDKTKTLVCLSGGQDSVTCLMEAAQTGGGTYAVSFNYGQRHSIELDCAAQAAKILKTAGYYALDIPALRQIGGSALLTGGDLNERRDGLPASFVPGRNAIFLAQAAALAYQLNCGRLVTGVSETDYSGYPDCREYTIKFLEAALNAAMETDLEIAAPLMRKTKAETWTMAYQYRVPPFDRADKQYGAELIREHTHTCYRGDRTVRHDWGYGCGECPACLLRRRGYAEFIGALK